MAEEQRATIRHRVLKGGHVVVNGGFSTFDCTIRNLSDSGARLRVASVIGIPDHFQLMLDDGQSFECQVAWRQETELGVQFRPAE